MTGVTAPRDAEATADREVTATTEMAELLEAVTYPAPGPVQITMHIDVLGIFQDCKTVAAFDDAMGVVLATVEGILEAIPE